MNFYSLSTFLIAAALALCQLDAQAASQALMAARLSSISEKKQYYRSY